MNVRRYTIQEISEAFHRCGEIVSMEALIKNLSRPEEEPKQKLLAWKTRNGTLRMLPEKATQSCLSFKWDHVPWLDEHAGDK